ncbi:hypothetical protein [Pseudonocardia sp.]|jgi:hypothetical protein|uniref:hypothetical protein n=1 Tax=Pseudonocardia sp. TaxID=60912 RepID=UPI0026058B07|nr:hypothetical protein [Pseudonocardia sp.]MCW2719525.1 hypothetical protein [Pseudonocardia sp.]MDT7615805.1 hypothetical protein [Pseudonocardiales bacterium]
MSQTMTHDQTMTQEHFNRALRTGQEAISTAVRTWGEAVQTAMGIGTGRGELPTPAHLVDGWFDIASEMLEAQREFAEGVLGLGNPAIEVMSRAAQQTAEAIEQSTHAASEEADRAVSTARRQRAERPADRADAAARKDG